jgi:TRAP transporter TAXI family solute receptor
LPIHRRRVLKSLAALGGVSLLTDATAWAKSPRFFRIGTGSTGGTYFPIGGLIASAISSPPGSRPCDRGGSCGVPDLIAVAQSTEGSVYNVAAVSEGRLESGLSQADVAYWAYTGTGVYEEAGRLPNLRAIANLYPEALQFVVRVDSGVHRIPDLVGKRVSLDREGSGTLVDAKLVLSAWGLTPDDLEVVNYPPDHAVEEVRRGELDGFFLVAGTPTAAISDLAHDTQIRLLPIDGEEADWLLDRYPFFARALVGAGTYHSVPAIETLSVGAQWMVSAEVDEELVFGITAALWHPTTRALLDGGHPKGELITFGTALNGVGVPLHPGAKRYYEERGVTVIEVEPNLEDEAPSDSGEPEMEATQ